MVVGAEPAMGIVAAAMYDSLRFGLAQLRRRRSQWSRAFFSALADRGVDLSPSERRRLEAWVRTCDVDRLVEASTDVRHDLVDSLAREVLDPAAGSPAAAGLLADALWAALPGALDPRELREVRVAVAARHGEQLAGSVLDELGWLRSTSEALARTLAPGLPLERAWLRPLPGVAVSPYQLLWARSGVVPFDDRGGWLEGLARWCAAPDRISVRLVAGTGGMGKTRLALQLCRRMAESGWIAGLHQRADAAAARALARQGAPRLVVVDYADSQPALVRELIGACAEHLPLRSCPVRILLLVRRLGETTDPRRWFTGPSDRVSQLIDAAEVLPVSTQRGGVGEGVDFPLAARQRLFASAVGAFAPYIDGADPAAVVTPALDGPTYGSPLLVSIAALLAVDPDASVPTSGGVAALLDRVLEREQRCHWAGAPVTGEGSQRRAVAVATLFGADDEAEAVRHLEVVPVWAGRPAAAAEVAEWLHGLYEGPRWVNPLEPDLLGEYLVGRCLDDALLARALAPPEPGSASAARALTVLARVAAGRADIGERVHDALRPRLAALVEEAMAQEVAGRDGQLLGPLIALVRLLDVSDIVDMGDSEDERWDRPFGQVGWQLAEVLGRQAIDGLRRRLAAEPHDRNRERLAWACNRVGLWLAQLGDDEGARIATEESVALYLELVERHRDDPAGRSHHLYLLAKSLNLHSVVLRRLGRLENAVVAIVDASLIRARLVEADPAGYVPGLALGLSNLAEYLTQMGRYHEGLAVSDVAVGLVRWMVEATPAATPYLPDRLLARSTLLGALGRPDESLADLAEAIAIRRRQAAVDPSTYSHMLASVLNNRAVELGDLGHHDDALAAGEEAVALYRRAVATNPGAHLDNLAVALANVAVELAELDRPADALVASTEALDIARTLTATHPARTLPNLAAMLDNHAELLDDLGRPDGRAAVAEAAATRRHFAEAYPGAFGTGLHRPSGRRPPVPSAATAPAPR
jgi:tetratricopeptide (TPR) repeat protein